MDQVDDRYFALLTEIFDASASIPLVIPDTGMLTDEDIKTFLDEDEV